ncbi:IS630 family transposase [Candidatus Parcubacteria bacterium]|nr:IS630 family transposase [Candidatus Parcubacteria bacterium]
MVADEVRIAKEANPDYVWSEKGKTPIKKKKLEIHQSTTIFGALSMKQGKIIQHHCKKKKKQTTFLLDKVKQFKEKYYPGTKKKILLLWDNASCHKSKEVKQWLRDNPGIVELDHFPPYSPEMNPIEHVWKVLKKEINHLRGEASLIEIMQEAKYFLNKKTFNYKLFGLKFF